MTRNASTALTLLGLSLTFAGCSTPAPVDRMGRPYIQKLGTVSSYVCESTPFVFQDRLYRFEAIRQDLKHNADGDFFHIIDRQTGRTLPSFAKGYRFGSAYVEDETVYVTATDKNAAEKIFIFASRDLRQWTSWTALDLPGFGIWNTSLCKDADGYVIMFEISKPAEQAGRGFTARFATSPDLKNWTLTRPECVYTKDRYSADGSLRYLDGYYYYFYCEAFARPDAPYAPQYATGYRTDVVRSPDLIHWQPSPFNPVLISEPDEEGKIANPKLGDEQRESIAQAAQADICNSDMDFCQYKGRVVINYNWGNQRGQDHLAEAIYPGTLKQFLNAWYPANP